MGTTHHHAAHPRDSDATRTRLLAAGRAEFALRGLAGARIDRIASAAQTNKRMIYAYYTSKVGLFDAVIEATIEQLLDQVPFTAHDLPGYAVAYFDQLLADPDALRLTMWRTVEADTPLPKERNSYIIKLEAIHDAQRNGVIVADLDPVDVLSMLLSLARSWLSAAEALRQSTSENESLNARLSAHRAGLHSVVRRALTTT